MATLAETSLAEAGTNDLESLLAAAAGGGDQFKYADNRALVVKNSDASSKTITITAQSTSTRKSGYGTVTKASKALVVAAGKIAVFPFLELTAFKDANNFVQVTYSAVTSVTVGVIEFPKLNN